MFYSEVHHIIEEDIYDVFLLAQSLTNNISQTLETENMYHNVKYEPFESVFYNYYHFVCDMNGVTQMHEGSSRGLAPCTSVLFFPLIFSP